MAHGHDTHTVVERDSANFAGPIVALVAIVLLALVAFAVLWAQPWDDDGGGDTTPGISNPVDDVIPGDTDGGTGGGDTGGGGTGGGTEGQ